MAASRPTPVLFIDSCLEYGGDSKVLLTMADALDRQDFCIYTALNPNGRIGTYMQERQHVRFIHSNFGQQPTLLPGAAGKLAAFISTAFRLAFTIYTKRIRLVHLNNVQSGRTMMMAILLQILTIGTIRLIYHGHCDSGASRISKAVAQRSAEIWAISKFIARHYRSIGVPRFRIRPMPNSHPFNPPLAPARDIRGDHGISPDAPLLLLTGRLTPTKGQDIALEAFADAMGQDACLLFLGDDQLPDNNADFVPSLKKRARELGVSERVIFAGFQRDPEPYFAAADAVLIPSRSEPFGLIALEAAAAGKPIIGSRVGGLREVLEEVAGLPVFSPEPEDFARGLSLWRSGELTPAPGEVRRRLANKFSEAAFAKRLIRALKELDAGPCKAHDDVNPRKGLS